MTLEEVVSGIADFSTWTETDRIRFFGWHLRVHQDKKRFETDDLRQCYDQLHLPDPPSFSPYFKSLENRKPKELLKDREGYYFSKHVLDQFTSRFGGALETVHISSRLASLPARLSNAAERGYIEEALTCIKVGASRAAIVLGWCAVIDRMRRKIEAVGFDKFNEASTRLKNQITGKFKHWNKGPQANTMDDLNPVFDNDLMIVLQGMGLLDDNQAERLRTMFQYRCHSAHPADAPIEPPHVVAFFTDAMDIVLANKKFDVPVQAPEPAKTQANDQTL
jgi:hypothetical protein